MAKQKPTGRSAFRHLGVRSCRRGSPPTIKVKLKARDRQKLDAMLRRGRESIRVLKRAQVLEQMAGGRTATQTAEALGVSQTMARDVANRYCAQGLDRALWDAPRPGKERVLKPKQEQQLVAMLCGPSPQGRARWTICLATEEVMSRGIVATIGRETVRETMKRHALKPWREKNVVHSGADEGVRRKDGGRAQPLREAAQSPGAGGVRG